MAITAEPIRGLNFATTDNDGVPIDPLTGAGGQLIQQNFLALDARLRQMRSVYEYGAAGNDSTDDHTALQNAIDDAEAVGGTVFIPPGVFRVGTRLVIPSDVTLIGATGSLIRPIVSGSFATTPAATGVSTKQNTRAIIVVTGDDVTLWGVNVRGDTPDSDDDHWDGIYLNECERAIVAYSRITDIGALSVTNAGGNRSAGIFMCRGGGGHTVHGCKIERVGYECIGIRRQGAAEGLVSRVNISDCHLAEGGAHCLALQPECSEINVHNIVCVNNQEWRDGGGQGVTCHGPRRSNISNIICRTYGSGFNAFDNAQNLSLSNAVLRGGTNAPVAIDRSARLRLWEDNAGVPSFGFRGSNIFCDTSAGTGANKRCVVIAGWNDVQIDALNVDHTVATGNFEAVRIGQGLEAGQPVAAATNVRIDGNVRAANSGTSSICFQLFGGSSDVQISGRGVGNFGVRFSTVTPPTRVTLRDLDIDGTNTKLTNPASGTATRIREVRGVPTEARITGTITNTNTSVTLNHGLTAWRTLTAADFTAGYAGNPNGGGVLSIGTVTSTQVTVNCASAVSADTAIVVVADASRQ